MKLCAGGVGEAVSLKVGRLEVEFFLFCPGRLGRLPRAASFGAIAAFCGISEIHVMYMYELTPEPITFFPVPINYL